jgi:hypothetical protein
MTCYEFALACDLKPNVPQEIINTLTYMTGKQDSSFDSVLTHPLFTSSEDGSYGDSIDYLADWKVIISNSWTGGVEEQPGIFGSIFKDNKLNVRKYIGDDEFYNAFSLLLDWLVSICKSTGFVGHYYCIEDQGWNDRIFSNPILIYFLDGKVFEKPVEGELRKLLSGGHSGD